jgi:hypothetical protein
MEPNHDPRILDAIFHGRKIEAIKLYRELNAGLGLKEAKDAVEKLAADLYARFPEKFTKAPVAGDSPAGCMAILFLLAGIVAYLLWRKFSK